MQFRAFILFLLVLTLFSADTSHAKSKKKSFLILNLRFEEKESFAMMIRKFVKINSIINKSNPMVQETLKANPHIKNWKRIPKGTKIRLYIAKEHIDSKKLNAYRRKFKRLGKARLKKKRENDKYWNISSQFGLINITSESDNTLSMNFKKVGLKYGHRLSQNYRYFINLSIVQFGSIDSSKATDEILAKSFLPEFGFGVSKKMSNKFSASLSYDFLNYFFINSKNNGFANISTDNIHRISIKPYYVLSPSLGALGSLGFIAGTASGFDLSLGINYSFGKKKNYSLALITYISSLDVSGNKESSNAHIVSFGYKF